MQQRPLLEAKSLSVLNRSGTSLDPLDRTSRTAGPPFQGLTAPDIQSHSEQVRTELSCQRRRSQHFIVHSDLFCVMVQSQPSRSSHVVQDNCSGQDSYSTSISHPGGEEVSIVVVPSVRPSGWQP